MKLLIASNNQKKLKELLVIVETAKLELEIVIPNQLGIVINPEENGNTLEANALIKAKEFNLASGMITIADDTGLEVDELAGRPGVYSARFAGENATDSDNREKLLRDIGNSENRAARFRTVICLFDGNEVKYFNGVCEGRISKKEKGSLGFGYDQLFIPNGYEETFAELDSAVKNKISHRAKALQLLIDYLKT